MKKEENKKDKSNFKTLITMKTVAWDICFNEIREFDK